MENLLTKKKVLKSNITKVCNEIEKTIDDKQKLELFEKKCNKFENETSELFDKIYELCEEKELDKFIKEQQTVQDSIDQAWISVKKKMSQFVLNKSNSSNSEVSTGINENLRLPKINLPSFGGNIHEWLSFKDLFCASIHNNSNLSESQKLSYLKLSLNGEAARIIQSISISDANYNIAWNLLEERFSNNKEQVFAHLRRFMSIGNIQSENPSSVLKLVDLAIESVRSLELLNQKIEGFSEVILAYILLQKLDPSTKLWFQRNSKKDELPTFSNLIVFLKDYARTLQASKPLSDTNIHRKNSANQKVTSLSVNMKDSKCLCCKSHDFHKLYNCSKFRNLNVNERVEFIKKSNLCFLCFSSSHGVRQCNSKFVCKICKKNRKHNSLICFESEEREIAAESNSRHGVGSRPNEFPPTANANRSDSQSAVNSSVLNAEAKPFEAYTAATGVINSGKNTFLSTAYVFIKTNEGNLIRAKALCDSGSVSCFCSTELANLLNLKSEKANISVCSISGHSTTVKRKTTALICNKEQTYKKKLEFLIIPKIAGTIPSKFIDVSNLMIPENLILADPDFYKPGKIDLLLGAEIFYDILRAGRIYVPHTSLILQYSVFGYIVSGSTNNPVQDNSSYCALVNENTETELKRFFELESIGIRDDPYCYEDDKALEMFKDTVCFKDGRYEVNLPWKKDWSELSDNYSVAEKRLKNLVKRMKYDKKLSSTYSEILDDYLRQDIIEKVSNTDKPINKPVFYLPHQPVFREDSASTKTRIVFDGSSHEVGQLSLNDCLWTGTNLNPNMFHLLINFRLFKVAIVADMEKAFLQLALSAKDRDAVRFLFVESTSSDDIKLQIYRFKRVNFGLKPSPFLLAATIKEHIEKYREQQPDAFEILNTCMYVDDFITGQDSVEEAVSISRTAKQIMNEANMNLRKWVTNDLQLMKRWEEEGFEIHPYKVCDSKESLKVLGISWNTYQDSLSLDTTSLIESLENRRNTKRFVLRTAGKIFDPLGLITPFTVRLKFLLQELWVRKLSWDDELPSDISQEWTKWCCECPDLGKITVPRFALDPDADSIEIHCFSDASQKAYGAVVYVRLSTQGKISVNFIASKCRVAPVKRVTLPRLELLGALLAARLGTEIKKIFDRKKTSKIIYWTDAKIVLCWIKGSSNKWKSFVVNRVNEIRKLTEPKDWFYCPTKDNPADALTRGVRADFLVNDSKWWSCSDFLTCSEISKQDLPVEIPENVCENELKRDLKTEHDNTNFSLITHSEQEFYSDILNLSTNYTKTIRTMSFIFRFIYNCQNPSIRKCGGLSLEEIKAAELWLLLGAQRGAFWEEIEQLKKGKPVSSKSKLASLNVFLDDMKLLRVGGRLSHSDLPANSKFPIVLPEKNQLTSNIVRYYHLKYLHLGSQSLLYHIRQKFWPINGRKICRKIVFECITCYKAKPVLGSQIMGDLPKERITPSFPFCNVGVDFCGPFHLKYKNQRKGVLNKVYVCIFVCLSTKAIHLDFVSDLTSKGFIACLKRFFSRRGKCTRLFSDNAKNFMGANVELKKLQRLVSYPDEVLSNYLSSESIDWKFIPPKSPNFGGLWEAGVRSFKLHLKRIVGNVHLTLEEFLTVILEIESVLNSRPLTPLSSDLDNFETLSPGHFLIGRPLTSIVEPQVADIPENMLSNWKRVTKYSQQIWKLWKRDYLNTLQERHKWQFAKNNVNVGTLVLIKEDNMPSTKWLTGRISEIIPGPDGKVRVVNVRLPNGKFLKRSVRHISILPLNEN